MDFLEQLCVAIPSTEEEVEDLLHKKTKTVRKLELRLADRRKQSHDGCACVSFVRLSISAIPLSQGFWYSRTLFSERNGCKHPTLW